MVMIGFGIGEVWAVAMTEGRIHIVIQSWISYQPTKLALNIQYGPYGHWIWIWSWCVCDWSTAFY